ncbi:helix-turn-helix domain-containing protein [Achromobacter anxifer]|uniref:helix-turn-helix domain-containing protein n=1 Tax=Achromobacter anxifer TaxID=1287737 RepID=UPI0015814442
MKHAEILPPILARLRELKHSDLTEVAQLSGVPESTLRKLRYGDVKDPRVHTVQALCNYFAALDHSTTVREEAA